jgi:hypothetical protein
VAAAGHDAVVVAAAGDGAAAAAAGAERTEEGIVMDGSIRMGGIALVAGLLLGLARVAGAQDELPKMAPKLDPVWNRLAASNAKFLNQDQQVLLDDLAFATAVAAGGCPGFRLDRQKFEDAFRSFSTDDYMKQSPDEKRRREYRLMMNFGATVALYQAEGVLHPKEACRFAEEKRAAGPGRFWVQPASATPAP